MDIWIAKNIKRETLRVPLTLEESPRIRYKQIVNQIVCAAARCKQLIFFGEEGANIKIERSAAHTRYIVGGDRDMTRRGVPIE